MGTPNRTSILDNLETTLTGITAGNGYNTTVDTVERVARAWDDPEIGVGNMPWLGILPGISVPEYQPGGNMRMTFPIMVIGHINSALSSKSDDLSNLEDDLIAVLSVDQTRGGYATSTTVKSILSDDGDPDSDEGSKGGAGTIVIELDIVYFRTTSAS